SPSKNVPQSARCSGSAAAPLDNRTHVSPSHSKEQLPRSKSNSPKNKKVDRSPAQDAAGPVNNAHVAYTPQPHRTTGGGSKWSAVKRSTTQADISTPDSDKKGGTPENDSKQGRKTKSQKKRPKK